MFPRTLFVPRLGGLVFRVRAQATGGERQDHQGHAKGGSGCDGLECAHDAFLVAFGEHVVAGLNVAVFVVRHDVGDTARFLDAENAKAAHQLGFAPGTAPDEYVRSFAKTKET